MHVRPIISAMAALLLLASVRAEAVSVRDIIELFCGRGERRGARRVDRG